MKKTFYILSILLLTFFWGNSQTNVSGGIFSDTTWTLANSPYIVTANIVVFPGVTLTIQPGVTVKFANNTNMEIRQSKLIAIGTFVNQIVFTSNSLTPIKGIWDRIWLNQSLNVQFKYCEFHYGDITLYGAGDSLSVVNSTFTDNITGMDAKGYNYIRVDSCTFRNNHTGQDMTQGSGSIRNCNYFNNQTGLIAGNSCNVINCILDSNTVYGLLKNMACHDTVRNNEIKYNSIGIASNIGGCGGFVHIYDNVIENNATGILIQAIGGTQQLNIYQNCICSNTSYNFQNQTALNLNAINNCWCSTNTAYIESSIYDAYDNVTCGIVTYNPIDTLLCPITTGTADNVLNLFQIYLYPNPFINELNIDMKENEQSVIIIYDITSRKLSQQAFKNSATINTEQLAKGIYIYEVRNKNGVIKKGKVVKE